MSNALPYRWPVALVHIWLSGNVCRSGNEGNESIDIDDNIPSYNMDSPNVLQGHRGSLQATNPAIWIAQAYLRGVGISVDKPTGPRTIGDDPQSPIWLYLELSLSRAHPQRSSLLKAWVCVWTCYLDSNCRRPPSCMRRRVPASDSICEWKLVRSPGSMVSRPRTALPRHANETGQEFDALLNHPRLAPGLQDFQDDNQDTGCLA